eukprot:3220364-Ditylum_brightwellii.AAC.2
MRLSAIPLQIKKAEAIQKTMLRQSECTDDCAYKKFCSQKGQERYISGLDQHMTKQDNHPQQEISEESKVNDTEDSNRERKSRRIALRKQQQAFLSMRDNKTKQLVTKMKNAGSYLYKNSELATRCNVEETLKKMPSSLYFNKSSNKKYHNLCTYKNPPEGIKELLGLGHTFVIVKRKSQPNIKKEKKQTKKSMSRDFI